MLPGLIVIWFGAIADIPEGWVICDGTNNTPNLTNRFIVGAGDTYDVDDIGGDESHFHSFTTDGHYHSLPGGSDIQAGTNRDLDTTVETDTGVTVPADNFPPYRSLAYIMKV